MNKFYKTSYPKTSSINQILKNKKQLKKQTFRKQDLLATHMNGFKQSLTNNQPKNKQKFHLDNKIEIDSDLLFNKNETMKRAKQTDRLGQNIPTGGSIINHSLGKPDRSSILQKIQKRRQQNKTQSRFYQPSEQTGTTTYMTPTPTRSQVRPQTKQQPRTRILSTNSEIKNQIQRPQTSKGSRKSGYTKKQRLISLQDQNQIDIIVISRNNSRQKHQEDKNGYNNSQIHRKNQTNKRKYNFQTTIDPQFLSLFAN